MENKTKKWKKYLENKLFLVILGAVIGAIATGIIQHYFYNLQQGDPVIIITPEGRDIYSANPDQTISFSYLVVNKRNHPIYISPSESGIIFRWNDWSIVENNESGMSISSEGRKIISEPPSPLPPNSYLKYSYKFKAPSKKGKYIFTIVVSTDEGKVIKDITLYVISQLQTSQE